MPSIPKDTTTFKYHNANPKGRKTSDCVTRAVCTATQLPYHQVVMELAELQCKIGYDKTDAKLFGKYLESKGFTKHKQPRNDDNTKCTGHDFCTALSVADAEGSMGFIVANIGGNHTVCIAPTNDGDGINCRYKVLDTWNSTGGCIGNYWVKGVSRVYL